MEGMTRSHESVARGDGTDFKERWTNAACPHAWHLNYFKLRIIRSLSLKILKSFRAKLGKVPCGGPHRSRQAANFLPK